ncbi:MAG: MtrAB system histidine kinase MtrB [Micrococcales bacterium]
MKSAQRLFALSGLFRRSLQARGVAFTLLLSGFATVILGGFLSYSIGNGLFQTRTQQILAESTRLISETQQTLSASSITDEVGLQSLVNAIVPKLELNSATQTRLVALIKAPNAAVTSVLLQSPISADFDTTLISKELREQVATNMGSVSYQSVKLMNQGREEPGMVVGSQVIVPLAGSYELFLLYSLHNEQQTLDFMQQTLVVGGLILMLIIGTVSYFVTNFLVRPVQEAADIAEKLSEGDLNQRMTERGQDVVAKLARSFNKMASSLRLKIQQYETISHLQQRFVSDVSHELRTPMTTIMMAGDRLFDNREQFDPQLKRSAELLHDQLDRFGRLLNDLLEISRYDAGQVNANFEWVDFNQVVQNSIDSIEPLAIKKATPIKFIPAKDGVLVELDSLRIERLLRNLLANAAEHGEGKPISVLVGFNATSVAVTVTDKGVGMTEEDSERVFDRFWRGDPSRVRTTGGNGLGLAISLEDAHLHNGWLQVWSRPNQGASFRLTLPINQELVIKTSPLPLPPQPKAKNA